MMIFPDRETVERVRREYPKGTRVRLLSMNDPYSAPPIGTEGVVQGVDDCASLLVQWNNGSSLSVLYGIDEVEIIKA